MSSTICACVGDIQRAHRLIAHQQLRLEDHRARNRHALALATRQFMRIAPEHLRLATRPAAASRQPPRGLATAIELGLMHTQRLAHDLRYRHARIEACERILKDDLQVAPQRRATARVAGRAASWPSQTMWPETGFTSCTTALASVDLPQPDSPTIPTDSPAPDACRSTSIQRAQTWSAAANPPASQRIAREDRQASNSARPGSIRGVAAARAEQRRGAAWRARSCLRMRMLSALRSMLRARRPPPRCDPPASRLRDRRCPATMPRS